MEHPALRTAEEVAANTVFRFLQVRGYVDDQHSLTTWGHALEAALAVADEEYTIVGVEMLRMGLFSGNFASGDPVSKTGASSGLTTWMKFANDTTDKDHDRKVNTNLISKVACLSRIRHKPMGFVGPLDRQLLTFAWKITAVRTTLRELLETIMTSMLLNGDVDRDREDWIQLAQKFVQFLICPDAPLTSFPDYLSQATMDRGMALLPRPTWMRSMKSQT